MAPQGFNQKTFARARDMGFSLDEAFELAKENDQDYTAPKDHYTTRHRDDDKLWEKYARNGGAVPYPSQSRYNTRGRDDDELWEKYARNGDAVPYPSQSRYTYTEYPSQSERSKADDRNDKRYNPHKHNLSENPLRKDRTEAKRASDCFTSGSKPQKYGRKSYRDDDERWERYAQNGRFSHNHGASRPDRSQSYRTPGGYAYHYTSSSNDESGAYAESGTRGRSDMNNSYDYYAQGNDAAQDQADDYPYYDYHYPGVGSHGCGGFSGFGGGSGDPFANTFGKMDGRGKSSRNPRDDCFDNMGGGFGGFGGYNQYYAPRYTAPQKDYYAILGISPSASTSDIKKAYYKLAMKHHPDRVASGKKQEATDKMAEINEAYGLLGNAAKKEEYDRHRY